MQLFEVIFLTAIGALAVFGLAHIVTVLLSPDADADAAPETQDDFTLAMRRWDRMLKDSDK